MNTSGTEAPWPGYDDLDSRDIATTFKANAIRAVKIQQDELRSVIAYETQHRNREDLLEMAYFWSNLMLVLSVGFDAAPPRPGGQTGWVPGDLFMPTGVVP